MSNTNGKEVAIRLDRWDDIPFDDGMLAFAFKVAARHAPQAKSIEIHPAVRDRDGFLQYLVVIVYIGGGGLTIGCIQRTPTSDYESHT